MEGAPLETRGKGESQARQHVDSFPLGIGQAALRGLATEAGIFSLRLSVYAAEEELVIRAAAFELAVSEHEAGLRRAAESEAAAVAEEAALVELADGMIPLAERQVSVAPLPGWRATRPQTTWSRSYQRRILGESKMRILMPRVESGSCFQPSGFRRGAKCCMGAPRGNDFLFTPLGTKRGKY